VDSNEFRKWAVKAANWGVDYRASLDDKPVRAQTEPGEVAAQLPTTPPEVAEGMDDIFADFENIIMPGMTHWQHPRFFAYFPANAAPPSVIAESLVSAMSAQCMLWQTSPAATELETRVLDWLGQGFGLPMISSGEGGFHGFIQDTASTATLTAILTMRERALDWAGNHAGLAGGKRVRVYCSDQVHTSIDRAIWVSGIGDENLVRTSGIGKSRGMSLSALEECIEADKAAGFIPAGIVACVGGTSVGGCDDVAGICEIAAKHGLYVHVDAAWAGSAMICPEFRHLWRGVEHADSVVVNPHKWLGAQFDCTAHFIRNPDEQVKTLAMNPEYLQTHGADGVVNYSEWHIPLGRRFRALKLWFLIRAYGLEGLRAKIRDHVKWAGELAGAIAAEPDFELITAPVLSLFSFRYVGDGRSGSAGDLDDMNIHLLKRINTDGRIYLTQTRVDGKLVIRFQAGSWDTTRADVMSTLDVLRDCSANV